MIDFSKRATDDKLREFARYIMKLNRQIGMKISARGWCYTMENLRYINKNQFDKIESWINKCRRKGFLPIDLVKEDSSRLFLGIEKLEIPQTYEEHIRKWLNATYENYVYYHPCLWGDEEYYVQMIVEKVDLVSLAEPIVGKYFIPIANARGWSSMLQRAEYAKRFKKAEEIGLTCVLLYFGDHDPDGLRIGEHIRKNLYDLQYIEWEDRTMGYDPTDLIIDRIGLNYDFIQKHKLTWIDNLITGNKKKIMDLSSPTHRNHKLPYVQSYIKKYGARKCEANACVIIKDITRKYIEDQIMKYYGKDGAKRFKNKQEKAESEILEIMQKSGIEDKIQEAIDLLDEYEDEQDEE